jgi:hypothetical protein
VTLIAAMKLHDVPVLIGDLLISSPHYDSHHSSLPTLISQEIDTVLPHNEDYFLPIIEGLQRKVAKLNDWLVVAWAGDYIAAKTTLKKMFEQLKEKRMSREKVFSFLDEVEDVGTISCTIIGWLSDKKGVVSFSWDSKTRNITTNGEPYIYGTGKEDFEKQLEEGYQYHSCSLYESN